MFEFAAAIVWLYRRRIGRAFLLAILSWVVLTFAWNRCPVGSTAFNVIAAIYSPGYRMGTYVARALSAGRYAAPLLGLGGVLVLFSVVWYVVLRVAAELRGNEGAGDASTM